MLYDLAACFTPATPAQALILAFYSLNALEDGPTAAFIGLMRPPFAAMSRSSCSWPKKALDDENLDFLRLSLPARGSTFAQLTDTYTKDQRASLHSALCTD